MAPNPKEVTTAPVRLAFPQLFEPKKAFEDSRRETYSATLLCPPTFDMGPLRAAAKFALTEMFGEKLPKLSDRGIPFRKCDDLEDPWDGYLPGWIFIRVASGYQPQVVNQRLQPVIDASQVYAGMWVRANVVAYAWDHKTGGKGVSFSLNSIQLVRDDQRLDGRKNAADVFDEIEVEDVPGTGGKVNDDDLPF